MIYLIITADYEVFGNGSGDVISCVIDPTNELLDVCNKYGAKLTIFFEVCEYWAFKKAEAEGRLTHLDYNPGQLMEEQAREAIAAGHDVQLHLHPQWLDSDYVDGRWRVNFDYWRLPNLPNGLGSFEDINSLRGLFKKGKDTLETLLQPVDPDYRCIAFRAGAWCMQPEREVLQALRENGIIIDSTVAPGLYLDDGLSYYDFRKVKDKRGIWKVSNSILDDNPEGEIIEVPVSTLKVQGWRVFIMKIFKKFNKNQNVSTFKPEGYYPSRRRGSFPKQLSRLFLPQWVMFDYCRRTAKEMEGFLISALEEDNRGGVSPLVAIGHPKDFANQEEVDRFLSRCSESYLQRGLVKFCTFRELEATLNKET
jgi:hypothetical protein